MDEAGDHRAVADRDRHPLAPIVEHETAHVQLVVDAFGEVALCNYPVKRHPQRRRDVARCCAGAKHAGLSGARERTRQDCENDDPGTHRAKS
jgi:hypothetical protein